MRIRIFAKCYISFFLFFSNKKGCYLETIITGTACNILKKNTPFIIFLNIVTFLLFNVTRVQSQPHFFRHYQVENGLSNNTVFSSMQDKDGFLWFGTKDGLNRFDGYHFKHFTINDEGHSLTPDIISCMLTDNKGTLFIGCQKGLYYFDK